MKKSITISAFFLGGILLNFLISKNINAAGSFLTPGPSCRIVADKHCADYSQVPPADLPATAAVCGAFNGVWSKDGCPAPGPCRDGQMGLIECDM